MKKKQAESLNVQTQSAILSKQVVQLILPLFPRKYLARIRSPGNFWAKVDKVSKMPTKATRGNKKRFVCWYGRPESIRGSFCIFLVFRKDTITFHPCQVKLCWSVVFNT